MQTMKMIPTESKVLKPVTVHAKNENKNSGHIINATKDKV